MANLETLLRIRVGEDYMVTQRAGAKSMDRAKVPAATKPHTEADLERALWFLYQQWRLVGFRPRGLYRMFTPCCEEYRGGIAAIQTILRQDGASGFEFLNYRGKRQLSLESLVLRAAWEHLFNADDKRIAQERLDGIAKGVDAECVDAKHIGAGR